MRFRHPRTGAALTAKQSELLLLASQGHTASYRSRLSRMPVVICNGVTFKSEAFNAIRGCFQKGTPVRLARGAASIGSDYLIKPEYYQMAFETVGRTTLAQHSADLAERGLRIALRKS